MEHVAATLADSFFLQDAGDFLRGPVEGGNPPLAVDGKDSVGYRVEDGPGYIIIFASVSHIANTPPSSISIR